MKIIPHEKDGGVFINKSKNLQICFTLVARPLTEESWEHNSYKKWIIFQAAQSINKKYA